mgnify:FL=1
MCIRDSIWAIKHTMRDIADTGLHICLELLNNIANTDPMIAGAFFQQYLLNILQDIFYVLTDTDHKSGFKTQCLLLARIFELIETDKVVVPLWDPAQVPDPAMNNRLFIRQYTANLLRVAFPHVQPQYIDQFVSGLCALSSDLVQYKVHLRDFLITSREVAGGSDNSDLFLEDKEAEARNRLALERENAAKIPGMLKPSQIVEEDEEL